jgi:hypothetical protein
VYFIGEKLHIILVILPDIDNYDTFELSKKEEGLNEIRN